MTSPIREAMEREEGMSAEAVAALVKRLPRVRPDFVDEVRELSRAKLGESS